MTAPFPRYGAQQLPEQDEHLIATLTRRDGPPDVVVVQDGTYPIAPPDQELGEGGRHLRADLFLGPVGGPEGHRRRAVDEQPGRKLAVLGELPHEHRVHPGADVPVDVANVIAVLVVAEVKVVGAVAAQGGAVIPLQSPVEPADHVPLEAPEDPVGCQRGGGAHRRWSSSTPASRMTTSGGGVAARIALITSSEVTLSPSAS